MKTAIDIEKLVTWALRDQGLGWSIGGGGDSLSGIAELGTRVDKSTMSAPTPALQTDDDALIVQRAIEALPADAQWLVVKYGRFADQPDWVDEGYGLPKQKIGGNGRGQWIYRDEKNKRGKIGPLLDWHAYDNHVRYVVFQRGEWAVWREALVALAGEISSKLDNHTLTRIFPKAKPWDSIPDDGPVPVPTGFSHEAKRAALPKNQIIGFEKPTDTDPANSQFAAAANEEEK